MCSSKHRVTGDNVAIKKVTKLFQKKILTKRALREIKLLHHFRGHKNITCLYDLDLVDPVNFDSVYLYEECMEADLHAIASRIYATRVKEDPIRLTTNERADRFDPDNPSRTRISRASSTRLFAV